MAEINPTPPLKPLWPVRRDETSSGKRRQPAPERRNGERDGEDNGDEAPHVIDEYV